MPVNWGLLSGDPTGEGFKSGNDYVTKLLATQAQKQAGALYGSGNTAGAVAALASNGQLDKAIQLQQGANQQTTFTQGQQDRTANIGAATALAKGDTAGAAAQAAATGDLSKVEGVNTFAQGEADRKAATFEKQQAVIRQTAPFLTQALQADPNSAAQAFDIIAPHLVGAGTDPAEVAKQKEQFLANPQQWIDAHSALAKYSIQKTEDGTVLAIDENNPSKPPLTIYKGGGKPQTEAGKAAEDLKNGLITQADYDGIVRKNNGVLSPEALQQKKDIAAARASANDGPPSDPEAIKNDVRIWLASKGTINPQYGQGKAGSDARHQFDVQKNGIMKELGVTPEDVASGRASRVSDQATLNMVSKVQAGNDIASNTMKNSIALARTLIPKGGAQGQSPVINRWIQAGRRSILGDKDVAVFNNHIDTIADEYAKIMGGGVNGSTASTDSARQDAHERISKADNAETLNSVLDGLVAETEGKKRSNLGEVEAVKARLRGYGGTGANAQAAPAAASKPDPLGIR